MLSLCYIVFLSGSLPFRLFLFGLPRPTKKSIPVLQEYQLYEKILRAKKKQIIQYMEILGQFW